MRLWKKSKFIEKDFDEDKDNLLDFLKKKVTEMQG